MESRTPLRGSFAYFLVAPRNMVTNVLIQENQLDATANVHEDTYIEIENPEHFRGLDRPQNKDK